MLVLLGLFVMHAIGLHGTPAGHGGSAAPGIAASATTAHHSAQPAAPSADPVPSATPGQADPTAMTMACLAMVLLVWALTGPRIRPARARQPLRVSLARPASAVAVAVPPPLLRILCISRT
ncbi:MAG: hypothetical protein QM804_14205 [Propionicimonas sp.]